MTKYPLIETLKIYSKAVQQELANARLSTLDAGEQRILTRLEEAFRRVEERMDVLIQENDG